MGTGTMTGFRLWVELVLAAMVALLVPTVAVVWVWVLLGV
jgi:hypothetical protein